MSSIVRTRTVTLLYSQEAKKYPIQSSAKTWGEFKIEAEAKGLSFENKKVRLRETKSLLDIPQSELAEGDCTLFVYPEKQKAGACKTLGERIGDLEKTISLLQVEVFGDCIDKEEVKTSLTQSKVAPIKKKSPPRKRPSTANKAIILNSKSALLAKSEDNPDDLESLLREAGDLE